LLAEHGEVTFPVPLRTLLLPEDAAPATRALQLVADGTIHSYDARRHVRRLAGGTVAGHIWVRALPSPTGRTALVVFMPEKSTDAPDAMIAEPAAPRITMSEPIVVGSFDAATRISQVSADATKVLATEPNALIGSAFVDLLAPDDLGPFFSALGGAASGHAGVGIRTHLRRADGSYATVRTVVTPAQDAAGPQFAFVLTSDTDDGVAARRDSASNEQRVALLEQHMWRIAAEVESAGVVDTLHRLPDQTEVPGLADLSTRQWQVLTALMRGERVPEIARNLCVSQSTVRNHLAKIFRVLGVHSQAELLARLREGNRQSV
jgi:DNA-binding CsgD family transcriptional regulator